MAAITKIEFWKDVGFLEGAIEIPRLDAPDPVNPDLTIEPDQPIIPSKERFFSKLKIREYFDELVEMSYIRLTYELNDKTMIFYGWVRDVSLESDGDLPMTVIDWHIDEWRTWKSAVTFGSGHVKRRPFRNIDTTPIQDYPIRFERLSPDDSIDSVRLFNTLTIGQNKIWWLIFSYNDTSDNNTKIYYGFFPVSINRHITFFDLASGQDTCQTLSFDDIYHGLFDERLKITPESLNGAWLSPFPLTAVTGSGTVADPFRSSWYLERVDQGQQNYFGFFLSDEPPVIKTNVTLNPPLISTEEGKYCIADMVGNRVLDLPYGMSVSNVEMTFVFEPTKPYMEISLMNQSNGSMIGCVTNVMFPLIPVNSNAYSSYVYGGQQEYDREMRQTRSNAQLWKSSIGGATQGAMIGSFGPMGAIAGMGLGATSGVINYGVESFYQNDKEQSIENKLRANQPSSMIMDADCLMAAERDYGWIIHKIVPDDYSAQQITATRNQFGISVDELMVSCDALVRTTSPTGYYNIQNLIVGGDVPVSAKRWIREKFKTGVRLI